MATGTAIPLIHGPPAERLRRMATYASVAVAAILIAAKFAAWLETGSVALLSSLVDSIREMRRRDIERTHAGMQTHERLGVVGW